MTIRRLIKDVPDFPKKGILFRDITPLLKDPDALRDVVEHMAAAWWERVDAIAALDARGFIFGTALAFHMELPLILVRKKGKLPRKTESISYGLEYGKDTLEIHTDAIRIGMRVLVVDDLLATGGTAKATCTLIERLGGEVAGCAFVVEVTGLGGRQVLANYDIYSRVVY